MVYNKIVVVGAGIVGINTALELQRVYPNIKITIIADKFNSETLSDGAAGIFRPGTYCFGPSFEISQEWINDSYNFYKSFLNNEPCGINEISGYMFSETLNDTTKNHYLEKCLPEYRKATEDELKLYSHNNRIKKCGSFFTTITIESKLFLPWALKKFINNGGEIIKKKIQSFDDICEKFNVIFNCSGLEAANLCNDNDMIPIRGQVIRVKAPWIDKFYYNDMDTYIIPSKEDGTVVLGGCRDFGNYDTTIQNRVTEQIIENCTNLIPSLKEAFNSEYKIWVGLRPYRYRIRVEAEHFKNAMIFHSEKVFRILFAASYSRQPKRYLNKQINYT
ncbi:D-aspartate oxidase-like isoform X2 [Daktulosphaira vitifoliae]|uniref:D-aspartate oxidase-like isoform X2 n=2 Tax=Daktulosphaira vitifoliae TaxID=58002 RepID=UPI0021A9F164|nr:D-aspartate oxidase-like isoform X2 [Daktulosphaira vitifoliae]